MKVYNNSGIMVMIVERSNAMISSSMMFIMRMVYSGGGGSNKGSYCFISVKQLASAVV